MEGEGDAYGRRKEEHNSKDVSKGIRTHTINYLPKILVIYISVCVYIYTYNSLSEVFPSGLTRLPSRATD